MVMKKIFLFIFLLIFLFSGCGSSESSDDLILANANSIIEKDITDDISINECLYNNELNSVYVKFYSFEHGNDEAIIKLDDNTIFYESINSTIKDDDYDRQIEYGDYVTMMYQITVNGSEAGWRTIDISE